MTDNNKQETTTALTLPQALELGEVLWKSGYFSDIKSAAQATVKVLRGQELGLGPVTALEQIHVVQGRTALSASLIGALIKRSGRYNYRVVKHTHEECEIVFYENGQEVGRSVFTVEDAEHAGLMKKDSWKQYTRNMLFARALSNGARWFCPDVFGGAVYTPEELEAKTIDIEHVLVTPEDNIAKESPSEPQRQLVSSNGSHISGKDKDSDRRAVWAAVKGSLREKYDEELIGQAMRKVLGVESSKDVPPEKWSDIRANLGSFVAAVEATCEELKTLTAGEDATIEEISAAPGA